MSCNFCGNDSVLLIALNGGGDGLNSPDVATDYVDAPVLVNNGVDGTVGWQVSC